MSFDCEVRFAGLCALVPNAPLDKASKMWVVMPNARSPKKGSICKHASVLAVGMEHLEGAGAVAAASSAAGGWFTWNLHHQEITLVPKSANSVAPLTVPEDDDDTAVRHVPDLAQIASEAATINPLFKADGKEPLLVTSRIIIEHGTLRTRSRKENLPVYFPGSEKLAPDAAEASRFAHDCVLHLGALDSLEIRARHLETSAVTTLCLAGSTNDCKVLFGNLCGDLWQLELTGIKPYAQEPVDGVVKDADFEAFYHLSNPVPTIRPVPTWLGGGGWGAKCHMARFNAFIEADNGI